jgi:hypothetical protein
LRSRSVIASLLERDMVVGSKLCCLLLTIMASTSEPDPAPNSLGLNFDQLKIQDPPDAEPKSEEPPQSPSQDAAAEGEKKKPYVNPERVKTGGNQRVRCLFCFCARPSNSEPQDKLSEEALSERMARMREQNEKIKQRRLVRLRPRLRPNAYSHTRTFKPTRRHSRRPRKPNASNLHRAERYKKVSLSRN